MKSLVLCFLLGLGALVAFPAEAQVSASSRITSTDSNLMLHVREARSESGLAPSVQAKVGPVSYSSKEGFGLNAATVDVCVDSLTTELPVVLPIDCRYDPSAFYPNLPATITVGDAQAQLNAYFAANKNAMAQYLRKIIKQNKTASAWYTFEAPLTVTVYTTTSLTDSEGNITYQTTSRQEERKVTWFLFADENGAAIAGNPKISDGTPEVVEVIFFPSNSQKFLDEEAIELPLGQIKWRKINATTGAPLSSFVTENVGSAYDMPGNETGLIQEGASVQPYVACLIKNDACQNNSVIDVSDLMSREGASAAVVRYLTPAVIATFPVSNTPNPDGTYDYREKVSLNVSSRIFDYQFSCINPKYTNTGSYNVEMNSAMHTYTANQNGEFSPLSSSPFSFQAYLSNKTYAYETTYPAAQQNNLVGLIIDPLRAPQLTSTSFYPGSIVAALDVRNKAEFCERPCGASSVSWRHLGNPDGQLCTATAPLVTHQGTRTVLATAENFSGSAQYRCDNGALSQVSPTTAQCVFTEPKKDCQAGASLSWSSGSAQCAASNSTVVPHGGSTTLSDVVSGASSTDGSGTARFSCDDGTLTLVSGTQDCTLPTPTTPDSGGGTTETPPPPTPEPPVVQPPVTPPVAIPDGYKVDPESASAEMGFNITSGDGLVFVSSAKRDGAGNWEYSIRSYQKVAGRYQLADTFRPNGITGLNTSTNLGDPAGLAYYGMAMDYHNGVLAVGANGFLANGQAAITSACCASRRNTQGLIDVIRVDKATGRMNLESRKPGYTNGQYVRLGSSVGVTDNRVFTVADDETINGNVDFRIFSVSSASPSDPFIVFPRTNGEPPKMTPVDGSRILLDYQSFGHGGNNAGQNLRILSDSGALGPLNFRTYDFTSYFNLPLTDGTSVQVQADAVQQVFVSPDATKFVVTSVSRTAGTANPPNKYYGLVRQGTISGTSVSGAFGGANWVVAGPGEATPYVMFQDNSNFVVYGGTGAFGSIFDILSKGYITSTISSVYKIPFTPTSRGAQVNQDTNYSTLFFEEGMLTKPSVRENGDILTLDSQGGLLNGALMVVNPSSMLVTDF